MIRSLSYGAVLLVVFLSCAAGRLGAASPDESFAKPQPVGKTSPLLFRGNGREAEQLPAWDEVAWPWQGDSTYLLQRERAIADFRSAGVNVHSKNLRRFRDLDEESVRKRIARSRVWGISAQTLDTEFGIELIGIHHQLTDALLLGNLKWFPEIKSLSLCSSKITDKGIRAILGLKYLETIYIAHIHPPTYPSLLTSRGMETISQCESLTNLSFIGVKLTDEGVKHLSRLPNLETLRIEGTFVTPECFRYLVDAPKLKYVSIRGNLGVMGSLFPSDIPEYDRLGGPLSPEAAEQMASAEGVGRSIWINKTDVVHPSLFKALCESPTVERIKITIGRGTGGPNGVGASSLKYIDGQTHLKYVECHETMVPTKEAIAVLERVSNPSVLLTTPDRRSPPGVAKRDVTIAEWLKWARQEVRE